MRPADRHNLSTRLLDASLDRYGRRPALRFAAGEWSFAELARRVGSAAGWLRDRGVGRGDIVLLRMYDGPGWVAAFLGAARRGAVCALASPALAPDRLRDATARLGPRAVIDEEPPDDLPDPGPAPVRAGDPCYMLLTSGTTGPSKWAVHRARDIPGCIATYGRHVLRLGPGDVTWSVAALPTSYGLGNSCYFPLGAGACAWIEGPDRSPAAAARACRDGRVTVMMGVPTSWARLARHVNEGRVDPGAFAGVRLAVSAGEPLPPEVWRAVRDATGMRLVNGLGSSEATNLYLSDRPGSPRPGTVGWRVPGFDLRVAPRPGTAEGEGELLVRGPTVMAGYHGDDAATARALEGGWLHTGDIVRRERDASYTYLGRTGDRFKSGGFWIDANRVRDALLAQRWVGAAAVVPFRDAEGLTRVGAAVVPRPGAPSDLAAHLRAGCAERLPAHEVPRALVVRDELPTTASGKIDRTEVVRWMSFSRPGTPAATTGSSA
jgi:acyl-coenzyme A synthetase/AMP-(fatty) acid ligase